MAKDLPGGRLPKLYVKLTAGGAVASDGPAGPWHRVADIVEAIDRIAGEGAYRGMANVIWLGASDDA